MPNNYLKQTEIESVTDVLFNRERLLQSPPHDLKQQDCDDLIANNFCEVGASGQYYKRDYIIDNLLNNTGCDTKLEMHNFKCLSLCSNSYLVTYMLFQNNCARISYRCSVWVYINHAWKIVYHQGTLTAT